MELLTAMACVASVALPTGLYWFYRLIKPISHFRIGIIDSAHQLYAQGKITRKVRDQEIKKFISIGDDALEEMMTRSVDTDPQLPERKFSPFDVPEQN